MSSLGRPKADLRLTESERDTLVEPAGGESTPRDVALRSRIVLACAQGVT